MGSSPVASVVVARLAATAAQGVSDVLGLHGGALGEVATYGKNGPVHGVRVRHAPSPRLQIRLIVRFGARLDEVAEAVRARITAAMAEDAPAFAEAPVDVHIADVRQPARDRSDDATVLRGPKPPGPEDAAARPAPKTWTRQP